MQKKVKSISIFSRRAAFSAALLLLVLQFGFVVAGQPHRNLLIFGTLISLSIGALLGWCGVKGSRRRAQGLHNGYLRPALPYAATGAALMLLYFFLLHDLYKQDAFHLTLFLGIAAGGCLVLWFHSVRRNGNSAHTNS